ncbi:hypothetical protein OPT61_g7327 [Boeremia exigua]|uniref:Uncharacterized protein n=1 Tax=Boeremia exigua TaxID=749465 RepID=A0ACC2I3P1_9PLEO|nr:hypothetical protein OPT61_g7327 [Boeremia exigua]
MSNTPQDPKVYHLRYQAARALFEDSPQGCISAAKRNLNDPTLPPYYVIKYHILVACALDDWRDADIFLNAAERAYRLTLLKLTNEGDDESLKLLKGLAKELKTLKQYREEDMSKLTSIGFDNVWDDNADEMGDTEEYQMDVYGMDVFPDGYSDVSDDDVQHEDGAAKDFDLPVRTKAPPQPPKPLKPPTTSRLSTPITNALLPTMTANMLSRKKSAYSNSGAFHAHSSTSQSARMALHQRTYETCSGRQTLQTVPH